MRFTNQRGEVVARLMQELVAARLVRTARGEIVITDLFGLKRLLDPSGAKRPAGGSHA